MSTFDLPDLVAEDPLEGGFTPAVQHPTVKILRFDVTPTGEIANGSYSWIRTTNPDAYLSWESSVNIYRIASTANDAVTGKDMTVNSYTYVSEGVDTGWLDVGGSLMSGDYRAIGNTLMKDLNLDHSRETLLDSSSATVNDIPAESEVAFAYLYWSAWQNYDGQMEADTTCTFEIESDTKTLKPNATGTYTQNDPVGDTPNYQCVDESTADDDSTYVKAGYELDILRPNAAGTSTQCDPVGATPNYNCVDETTADDDSTYVKTGDSLILRPNDSGYYTECDAEGAWNNYQCVDETTTDEDSTYVSTSGGDTERDTYDITNHGSVTGTINSVTVYARTRGTASGHAAETVLRTNSNNYYGTKTSLTTSYTDLSKTYTTNPSTSSAWTWTEIDALQVGVRQYDQGSGSVRTTQVYAEVSYGVASEQEMDTYNVTNHTGSGTINSVTVYIRTMATTSGHSVQTVLRTNGTYYYGTATAALTSYTVLSKTYNTNPYTLSAWTWTEIDALEAGVKHSKSGGGMVRTTQVYVAVDYGTASGVKMDTYNIEDRAEASGAINSVTVYIRSRGTTSENTHAVETVIRTYDTDYFGTSTLLPTSYTDISKTYTTNPSTSSAWTWTEIDALQAGVRQHDNGSGSVRTTQVYVIVDYKGTVEVELTADTWWLVVNSSPDYSYSCFKDVTDLVSSVRPGGNATYRVGSIHGDVGTEWSYAGWSLILIYSNPYAGGHQFFLWDRMMFAGTNDYGSFTIGGFYAPVDAQATLTCFVTEGDDWYSGDSLQFNATYMTDATNPSNNVWNSKSSALAGEPIEGVDIDTFDVSSPIINEGDSSATVYFSTTSDNWNLIYLILAFRSELAVLTPSSTGIYSYGF